MAIVDEGLYPPVNRDDGMEHDYATCPDCKDIVSMANMVRVDGRPMCRDCMKRLRRERKGLA